MGVVLIAYASDHGQTKKISERIASVLREFGHEVRLLDVRESRGDFAFPEGGSGPDAILVGGSIRMGKHQRELIEFTGLRRAALQRLPNAFYSVSLSASHATPAAIREVKKTMARFIADTSWTPQRMISVAGALVYSEYGFFIRQMLRLISWMAGGDTDTSRDYEYTDWAAVEAFAREFAGGIPLAASPGQPRPRPQARA